MAGVDEKKRTFLGAGLDGETRDLLAAHLEAHLRRLPGRAVPPANWHVTLRFLGWAHPTEIDLLSREVSSRVPAGEFEIRFGGLGAFPRPRRASVLWLGLAGGIEEIGEVARACEEAAVAAGFAPEDRPFHPHLTLARIRPPENLEPTLETFPPFDVRMAVKEVTLFRSRLGRGGARYEPLESFPL